MQQPEDEYVYAYRVDPTGKYGGKEGMETKPKKFNRKKLQNYMKAFSVGKKYGAPTHMTPEDFYALLMKEGVDNFGVNQYDKNDKKSGEIYMKTYLDLVKEGLEPLEADELAKFPAALYDAYKRASKHGTNMGHAYSGMGYSPVVKKTGKQMGEMMKQQYAGYDYAKNADLINLIKKWGGFADSPRNVKADAGPGIDQSIDQTNQTLSNLSAMRAKEQPSASMPDVPQEKTMQSPMSAMERSAS